MANGASTNLFQQAIQLLMQGRQPSPLAPVPLAPAGDIGPLSMDTTAALRALQPEPVPPQMPQPVDMDAIRARFSGLAGPEPIAPTAQPVSLIQKIALALQGFGAGTQGQGPQFLAGLREERARPQREFEAKKERFESRKAELGLLAEQEVGRAEDRRATRAQALLDQQFEREFEEGARRLKLRDQEELDLFRDTLLAKRQREDDERAAKAAEAKAARDAKIAETEGAKERQKEIRKQADVFMDDFRISRSQAVRFAQHEVEGIPLAGADRKAYARIEKYRAPTGGTGGGSTGPVMALLEDGTIVPLAAVNRDTGRAVLGGKPLRVVGYVGGRIPNQSQQQQAAPPAFSPPAFPEFSGGLLTGGAGSTGKSIKMEAVRRHAAKTRTSPTQAAQQFKDAGYTIE